MKLVPATPKDALQIAILSNLAASGTSFARWQQLAGPSGDPWARGAKSVEQESGEFSHRNCYLLKSEDAAVTGLLNSFQMVPDTASDEPDWLPYAAPFQELEASCVGNWYINFLAVHEPYRGQGLAGRLLDHAMVLAQSAGLPIVNLVVLGSKSPVIRLYEKNGFAIKKTLPAVPMGDQFHNDCWHLMEKRL